MVLFFASLAGPSSAVMSGPDIEHWLILALARINCFGPRFERLAARAGEGVRWPFVETLGYAALIVTVFLFINCAQDIIYFQF